ncbi:hypothetical protein [Streptomyces sp. NBC_00582]|uniref:hypothetical protein n=1 Tax=Streptomyces sp. NBC_00582 TaxID=2975783 RepID=UPI002E8006EF|nr:hypothetical protein [Streptomyces sp. NBC_00582]WUB64658.1 hypothetical protein OG852_31770 [Streptomyces sp. NBC_00582]
MSWANTPDRKARTAAARRASHHTRFLAKARELHPNASEAEIANVAESLRSAHYSALALKSAAARRAKREVAQAAKKRATQQQIAQYRPGAAAA